MAKTRLPKANIEWTKIRPGMCVRDVGNAFVAEIKKGKKAVVFWGGRDAREAQSFLKSRAQTKVYCAR